LALAVSVKLNLSLGGVLSNLDVLSMYEKAISENVPFRSWPNFVSAEISTQFYEKDNHVQQDLNIDLRDEP